MTRLIVILSLALAGLVSDPLPVPPAAQPAAVSDPALAAAVSPPVSVDDAVLGVAVSPPVSVDDPVLGAVVSTPEALDDPVLGLAAPASTDATVAVLADSLSPASAPDSPLPAAAQVDQVSGYLTGTPALVQSTAKAMYDAASRPALYAQLVPLPSDRRAGLTAPVKSHGWYYLHKDQLNADKLARCAAAFARMKADYPLPCVIVNHELLTDPLGPKLMAIFGDADVLLWVDCSPAAADVVALADFLRAYGPHVPGVVLGHLSMMAGTREHLGHTDPRVILSDADVINFWGGLIRWALPGRSLLWVWHHHQPGRDGLDYDKQMLPKLAGLNLDGICLWGFPNAVTWSGDDGAKLAAMPRHWFGKDGMFLVGDWCVDTVLLWPTTDSTTPRFAKAAKLAASRIAPTEGRLLPLGGVVRYVGKIPDSYRVVEDVAK